MHHLLVVNPEDIQSLEPKPNILLGYRACFLVAACVNHNAIYFPFNGFVQLCLHLIGNLFKASQIISYFERQFSPEDLANSRQCLEILLYKLRVFKFRLSLEILLRANTVIVCLFTPKPILKRSWAIFRQVN